MLSRISLPNVSTMKIEELHNGLCNLEVGSWKIQLNLSVFYVVLVQVLRATANNSKLVCAVSEIFTTVCQHQVSPGFCYGMPPCDMSHGHDSPNMNVASVNQNYAHGVKEARTEILSALFRGHVDSQ
jgi:hypothetical protein